MKIGIDNYSYHRYFGEVYPRQKAPGIRWGLDEFLDQMREKHKDAEGFSLETCFITANERKSLLQRLEKIDKEVMFAWGHPNGFMDIPANDAICEVNEFIELSAKLGFDRMRIAASSITYLNKPHEPQIDQAIKCIRSIIPVAAHYNVKLGLENHGDFYLHEMLKILEEIDSPYLGVTFDTGNSLRMNEDHLDSIKAYGEKLIAVHAKDIGPEKDVPKDHIGYWNCVTAGQGVTDFAAVFRALDEIRFDGMVLLEISRLHSDYEHLDEAEVLEEGLQYLRKVREQVK